MFVYIPFGNNFGDIVRRLDQHMPDLLNSNFVVFVHKGQLSQVPGIMYDHHIPVVWEVKSDGTQRTSRDNIATPPPTINDIVIFNSDSPYLQWALLRYFSGQATLHVLEVDGVKKLDPVACPYSEPLPTEKRIAIAKGVS